MAVQGLAWKLAQNAIPDLLAQGLSMNKGLTWMIEHGMGIRRQDFARLWNEAKGTSIFRETQKFTPKKFLPKFNTILRTPRDIGGRYQYLFERNEVDPITGEPRRRSYSILTDRLLTWGQATDAMNDQLAGTQELYGAITGSEGTLEQVAVYQRIA